MLLHVDTDFAGDTDDACALAMALGWPEAEVVGVTTTADPGGQRAGYVAHFLELAGRPEIPVEAGAAVSSTTGRPMGGLPDHDRYWPEPVAARPSEPSAALDLLDHSIERRAAVLAIGPYTNLALLEKAQPGRLDQVPVVIMGGWVRPPENGLPQWGPEEDWNVQCDTQAALAVSGLSRLTMVTLTAALGAHLRAGDLPRLAHSGPIGQLLAHQARAYGAEHGMSALGRAHPTLPDDLLNFHFDPVACALALGWQGAEIEMVEIEPDLRGEVLRFRAAGKGHTQLVVAVDDDAFTETWLTAVETAERRR